MTPPAIRSVRATDDRLIFELDQDREVSLPLSISARLSAATPQQRGRFEIGYGGMDVHWPDVDEDIAVWQVLGITESQFFDWFREAPVG